MAATDFRVFPLANNIIRVYVSFFTTAGALVTGLTGGSVSVGADGVSAGANLSITEGVPAGTAFFDVPAAYTTGKTCLALVCSVTNSGAVPVVIYVPLTQLLTTTPSVEPTNINEMTMWIYATLMAQGQFNNGGGLSTTGIPNSWSGLSPGATPLVLGQQLSTPSITSVFRGEIQPGVGGWVTP